MRRSSGELMIDFLRALFLYQSKFFNKDTVPKEGERGTELAYQAATNHGKIAILAKVAEKKGFVKIEPVKHGTKDVPAYILTKRGYHFISDFNAFEAEYGQLLLSVYDVQKLADDQILLIRNRKNLKETLPQ